MDITFLHCPGCQQGRASGTGALKCVHCVPAPQQTLRNLFSRCFYDWVFRAWMCRAWGEQPPQDNAGKWVLGIKNIFIFVSKARCAPAFSSAHHCNSRAVGTAPPRVCVYGNGVQTQKGLWDGAAPSPSPCPYGKRHPRTRCQAPHPEHPA